MRKKTIVGAAVLTIVLSAGGIAIAAQSVDDGTVPAKITNPGYQKGTDKAVDEALDTGWMPVVGRDGSRVGVVAWSDLNARPRPEEMTVYDKPASEGGVPVGKLSNREGFVANQAAK